MSDPRQELVDLVADVRATLEAARARGVTDEAGLSPVEAPPAAEPPAPARETLVQIRADLGDCQRCPLSRGRRSIVFGVGDPGADLMVVGEAPGFHEDRVGEPFVGKAGEMLDRMLVNVLGLRRDQVYIANIVKCRPPDNRNPAPDEAGTCLPFLHRQIRAIAPRVILVLGSVALKNLLDTTQGITRARGVWVDFEGIPVMPTFHPAYLLRQPQQKRLTFQDLKAVRARYDTLGGRR